jgi:hypothetical protein
LAWVKNNTNVDYTKIIFGNVIKCYVSSYNKSKNTMAKNSNQEVIPPYKCVESLKRFNDLLFGYRQTYDMLLQFTKTTPTEKHSLREQLVKIAEEHKRNIDQFYPE